MLTIALILPPPSGRTRMMNWSLRLLIVLGLSLAAPVAHAQALTQNTQLAFGALQKPSSGSKTFTVTRTGATSGTGTKLYGTTTAGSYRITRGSLPTGTVTIDIQNASTGSAAVTLGTFTGKWGNTNIASFPRSGLTRPTVAGTILLIGATLTYTSAVSTGSLSPTFDIVLTQP